MHITVNIEVEELPVLLPLMEQEDTGRDFNDYEADHDDGQPSQETNRPALVSRRPS